MPLNTGKILTYVEKNFFIFKYEPGMFWKFTSDDLGLTLDLDMTWTYTINNVTCLTTD